MAAGLINHHRVGTGSPLVLIHGVGLGWQCWSPVLPGLASRHDVIAVDLPGFAGSGNLGVAHPTLASLAQSVLELVDSLGIDRFHVCGSSLGGGVSIELLRSGRVLSYHGISPIGRTNGPYRHATKFIARSAVYGAKAAAPVAPSLMRLRPMRILAAGTMLGHPARASRAYATALITEAASAKNFEPTLQQVVADPKPIEIPSFDGPAQMLWGTHDMVLPVSAAKRFEKDWPGLQVVRMPGLGHLPMEDDPKLVVDSILRVTARVDTAAAVATRPITRN